MCGKTKKELSICINRPPGKIVKKKTNKTTDIYVTCKKLRVQSKCRGLLRIWGKYTKRMVRFPSKPGARTEEMGREPQSGEGKKNRESLEAWNNE